MWPPSTPIRAAISPFLCASRISAAVVASTISRGCLRTCSRTASIWSSARSTASGPVTLLGIQMEKKMALSPPSFMRGMSMLPLAARSPRSNLPSRKRWVVSSWVSTTMEEKCSLRAFSETEPAESAKPATTRDREPSDKSKARVIYSPGEIIGRTPDCNRKQSAREGKVRAQRREENWLLSVLASEPAEERLLPGFAIYFRERFGEGNAFGTGDHAVLRVGAVFDAAVAHCRSEALFGVHFSCGMHVEQAHL